MRISALFVSGVAGWAAFIAAFAAYVFLIPHPPGFAPEIGPFGSFVFFGVVFTACYLLEYMLIAVPSYVLFRSRRSIIRFWPRCFLGGLLFALGAAALACLDSIDSGRALEAPLYVIVLGFIAGFAAFAFLVMKLKLPKRQ